MSRYYHLTPCRAGALLHKRHDEVLIPGWPKQIGHCAERVGDKAFAAAKAPRGKIASGKREGVLSALLFVMQGPAYVVQAAASVFFLRTLSWRASAGSSVAGRAP